jgi:hypothetical protein
MGENGRVSLVQRVKMGTIERFLHVAETGAQSDYRVDNFFFAKPEDKAC